MMEYRRSHPKDWCSPVAIKVLRDLERHEKRKAKLIHTYQGRGAARKSYEHTRRLGWTNHCNVKRGFRRYTVYYLPPYDPEYSSPRKKMKLRMRSL